MVILRLNNAFEAASEAKVTDLNRAIVINEDVSGFQITVDDLTPVQIVKAAEHIVNN